MFGSNHITIARDINAHTNVDNRKLIVPVTGYRLPVTRFTTPAEKKWVKNTGYAISPEVMLKSVEF
jgi:hypothetical protein